MRSTTSTYTLTQHLLRGIDSFHSIAQRAMEGKVRGIKNAEIDNFRSESVESTKNLSENRITRKLHGSLRINKITPTRTQSRQNRQNRLESQSQNAHTHIHASLCINIVKFISNRSNNPPAIVQHESVHDWLHPLIERTGFRSILHGRAIPARMQYIRVLLYLQIIIHFEFLSYTNAKLRHSNSLLIDLNQSHLFCMKSAGVSIQYDTYKWKYIYQQKYSIVVYMVTFEGMRNHKFQRRVVIVAEQVSRIISAACKFAWSSRFALTRACRQKKHSRRGVNRAGSRFPLRSAGCLVTCIHPAYPTLTHREDLRAVLRDLSTERTC